MYASRTVHQHIPASCTTAIGGSRQKSSHYFRVSINEACLRSSTAHLWAAVLASSTAPPCIQLRTAFMPPSGSSFRVLPLLWMLSWIPNIKTKSPVWVDIWSFGLSSPETGTCSPSDPSLIHCNQPRCALCCGCSLRFARKTNRTILVLGSVS